MFWACGSGRTAEEASGLFPHAWGRARPSDPHSEQPVCVCVRVGERVPVGLWVFVYVRVLCGVCTYICRENVSTIADFRHLSTTDISYLVVFLRGSVPARIFRYSFLAVFCDQRLYLRDYFVFNVSCCVTAWGSAPACYVLDCYSSCFFPQTFVILPVSTVPRCIGEFSRRK